MTRRRGRVGGRIRNRRGTGEALCATWHEEKGEGEGEGEAEK